MTLTKRGKNTYLPAITVRISHGKQAVLAQMSRNPDRPRGLRRTDAEVTAILREMTPDGRAQLWRCLMALSKERTRG